MKKQILPFLVSLATALVAVPASAQVQPEAQWTDSTLVVRYQLQPEAVGSDYSCIVSSRLCSPVDTLDLATQIWRGKRNARKLRRAVFFGESQLGPDYMPLKEAQPRTCTAVFPFKQYPWLKDHLLKLQVSAEKEGCCEVETLGDSIIGKFAYVPKFVPRLPKIEDDRGRAGHLEKKHPVLHHVSQCRDYTPDRVLRKERGALYVHFELDKADLKSDFRNNASTLDQVVHITREIFADTTSQVVQIQIIGLASPEGTVRRNRWLGEHRGQALKNYIQERIPQAADSLFYVVNGGEAWTELRDQIADSDIESRDELLHIIDSEKNPDRRERLLKSFNHGKAYAFLRDNMLKDQRNSGYISICYDYKADYRAQLINRAIGLIGLKQYEKAVKMLMTVKMDRRSHNALGSALLMLDRREEARRYLRSAANQGSADAKLNLQLLDRIEKAENSLR